MADLKAPSAGPSHPHVRHETPQHSGLTTLWIDVSSEFERGDGGIAMLTNVEAVDVRAAAPTQRHCVVDPGFSSDIRRTPEYEVRREEMFKSDSIAPMHRRGKSANTLTDFCGALRPFR